MRSFLLSRTPIVVMALLLFPTPASAEWEGDPYLLPNDPVTDQPLAGVEEPVVLRHEGREFRFAGQDSADTFLAHPGAYTPKVDAAMVAQQMPAYPLTKCPVSGGDLGSMGEPINLIHKNRLVRLCCKGCLARFEENPAATVEKLDAAVIAAQAPLYADGVCPVSGMKLGSMGEPLDKVVGNRLVRFCCAGCPAKFDANPQAYLGKLPALPNPEHPGHENVGEADAGHAEHDHE